ncbi:MAG: preprotein translocase subunit SecY [Candidatus Hydrogenedentes bacterium]|nr:preprotein translocase subunit SecY [Candidatus Hydrogenedentota bacterium]
MAQPIAAFRNSFKIPELKQRIIFTVLALVAYRFGAVVPTPGVKGQALAARIEDIGGLLSFYNLFSGGAFAQATIFALGIMPYISASIIMSLLVVVVPQLEALQKMGAEGQKRINEYTRYGTIILCIVQSLGVARFLVGLNASTPDAPILMTDTPGFGFYMMCVLSFTTGTAFLMWLGEQISEHGVGNGISLIIFASIISGMPAAVATVMQLLSSGELSIFVFLIMVSVFVFVVAGTILVTTGQRRIPVQYPRQVKGRKVYSGARNYLPLRVNQAGVIPIIFASSLLMLPTMVAGNVDVGWLNVIFNEWFAYGGWAYSVAFGAMIMFFSFFYTAITFNPVEMADNMKKYGGVIIGVRPGKATAEYLNKVMTRVTLVGSLFLVAVALLPNVMYSTLKIYNFNVTQFFGGTSLLILVGVGLDTIKQMEQHLIMRNYEGFAKGGRIRSRRG